MTPVVITVFEKVASEFLARELNVPATTAAAIATDLGKEAKKKIEADPKAKNAANMERWWESRVLIGNYVNAAAPFIGVILGREFGQEDQIYATAIIWFVIQAVGFGLSTYGRVKKGAAPMWSRVRAWASNR